MTPALPLAQEINAQVNADMRYKADIALYGIDEFWTVAEHEGDCEDYALAKRQMLTEQGYGDACRLATCWTLRLPWLVVGWGFGLPTSLLETTFLSA